MNLGICPLIIKLLINLYNNKRGIIKWDSYYSDGFEIYNDIRQSGVFSPTLYTLYFNELIKIIHNICLCRFVYVLYC